MKKFLLFLFLVCFGITAFSQGKVEITTILKEKFKDKNGDPLTGKGVIIGDVDSGIDVMHPMFFFADGGEFDWIDTDNDGKAVMGKDAIDLNRNGIADSDEILRHLEMENNTWDIVSNPPGYTPDMDFLYVDRNNNKKRDYGVGKGFTENDPTYGEQFFILRDENKNGKIDLGEKLSALKTSKIRAVREKDGLVRKRGVDLILTEYDSSGHGTGVAGLILGGHYGVQKIHGIAPDAEIVIASVKYNYIPRFVTNFPDLVRFVKDENANILLFEDGEWAWEFMDGSTEEEQLVDEYARNGMLIVGGAGNLATGNMHVQDKLQPGKKVTFNIEAPKRTEQKINDGIFVSFLWRDTQNNIKFVVESPDKKETNELSTGSGIISSGKYNIFYSRDVSPKGTVMFRLGFSEKDSGTVEGKWKIKILSENEQVIDGYIVDVSQSWGGTTHFTGNKITDERTVTHPSTSDSCMAIGAYVVNFGWFDKIGDLASYSGRGYNVNGKLGVDLTGPGHTTVTTEKDFGYETFSGTSSAAPHVVGAAALMLQYDPKLKHEDIRIILRNTATADIFTGNVPNTNWGYGKLNIENALKYLINNNP